MACGYDEQHSVTNTNYCMAVEEHCIARYVILYDILLSCCYLILLSCRYVILYDEMKCDAAGRLLLNGDKDGGAAVARGSDTCTDAKKPGDPLLFWFYTG